MSVSGTGLGDTQAVANSMKDPRCYSALRQTAYRTFSSTAYVGDWVKSGILPRPPMKSALIKRKLFRFAWLSSWQYPGIGSQLRRLGQDLAREIREFFLPDFCRWRDHNCIQRGFWPPFARPASFRELISSTSNTRYSVVKVRCYHLGGRPDYRPPVRQRGD